MENTATIRRMAVEEQGVSKEVLDMWANGLTAVAISEELKKKGIEISNVSIAKWLKTQQLAMEEKKHVEIESARQFKTLVVNYQKEITSILDEVKIMKQKAIETEDMNTYVKLVGRLYEGLELLAKLLGDIKPSGSIDINIIIDEINKTKFVENKDARNNLYNKGSEVIDIEAVITKEDEEAEKNLNKVN